MKKYILIKGEYPFSYETSDFFYENQKGNVKNVILIEPTHSFGHGNNNLIWNWGFNLDIVSPSESANSIDFPDFTIRQMQYEFGERKLVLIIDSPPNVFGHRHSVSLMDSDDDLSISIINILRGLPGKFENLEA